MNKQTKNLIVIPARFNSTRLPGKPLIKLKNLTMLEWVYTKAQQAALKLQDCEIIIATESEQIVEFARDKNFNVELTSAACSSGTERAYQAINQLGITPKYVVNLQGDAPLTPPDLIVSLFKELELASCDVVTPAVQLSWDNLDNLRNNKIRNPFSGTTVILDNNDCAVWFSKNILPAMREEESLRAQHKVSPVLQHLGLYGYTMNALEQFIALPPSFYENLEGLEQLRFLENGLIIKIIFTNNDVGRIWRGVDSIDDANFVEQYL